MKSNDIKRAALKYFTLHGYEGASLSQIADEVGMKKQSLYAHFKGKDDLFLQVVHDAKEAELSSIIRYFAQIGPQNPENALFGFLQLINDLFQESEQLKFWLRMSFFPPAHLVDAVEIEVIDIENKVQALLEGRFREWIDADLIAADSARTATLAFSGIVDSIMLELVYGNNQKRLKDKLEASWTVFWRGISHH
ncbi:TetR/AcrR family transcriptional regulator [Paenibacillus contaminans]|uniref:TetR/AcrR family transcriptional regulator n=1 Tax=Paenibacillus contaminans TaxID=450362 RepID=A0A329M3D8_9BACL|nr:TetR/AcrR family transcriptional regulator [Paenibacillus contaminans]RAV14394.1 TetR/AcrR family transcriptional regulator [Paenibacillus contaminans]